ncbi:hypothetical protein LTR10_017202 [Elasticomyces elasticus]|uniref:Uncharacterized protein n=1 Tax=Exophiala sideris TaxID=1016849 RepID=A0ABR0J581_9EURO|nr:hypothetical protein LTR10_017202 [Elasticomyces elasticus]KAK5028442.1 hypothetical protein LTS07_006533 [Exophiala sideris]KAK5035915.1 hypothetical protein LTR13_005485 [Exophiala sideris]KAK5056951.1 hypothetical protein LTR69_007589 [Exophiala sideris]KAK5181358.1 hypothetical protein LTR44_006153 [Eurotiomycetes sp. CCFEE 6388]
MEHLLQVHQDVPARKARSRASVQCIAENELEEVSDGHVFSLNLADIRHRWIDLLKQAWNERQQLQKAKAKNTKGVRKSEG